MTHQGPATGRLAPSPTGAQHLGNARTYLLAYWSARSIGARLIMRIEDIDSPRVKPWARQQAIDDLRWLGIDWDEGPDVPYRPTDGPPTVQGAHGPYIQTERVALYQTALERLITQDRVFPCTCSRKDIAAAASAPHEGESPIAHEGPIYPGTCASWSNGDGIPQQGTFCWWFRPSDREIRFTDIVTGDQSCHVAKQLGAFPVTQKSGQFAYQLAVVVDDALMEITEVVRGDDLIPSTYRQLELYDALGYQPPRFAHVPLVKGTDGRRLAKRHGDTRLSTFRQQGVSPQQIVGWAAHSAGVTENDAPIAAADVITQFDWTKLNRQSIVVDPNHFSS
ncbi:MAG: tRNA glutamyl-Q(34) synthetase GluQRS [Pirellulaceae bacterium]|nr:tRNA glutamyl-Q(34) synthetase GluQRS [Pirellulaceae bacterium]